MQAGAVRLHCGQKYCKVGTDSSQSMFPVMLFAGRQAAGLWCLCFMGVTVVRTTWLHSTEDTDTRLQ